MYLIQPNSTFKSHETDMTEEMPQISSHKMGYFFLRKKEKRIKKYFLLHYPISLEKFAVFRDSRTKDAAVSGPWIRFMTEHSRHGALDVHSQKAPNFL